MLAKRTLGNALACILIFAGAAACVSPEARDPLAAGVSGVIEARFEVFGAGGAAQPPSGYVARTRYSFPAGDLLLWIVENPEFQEIGYIDEHGRAFRFRPFHRDAEWVATASLEEGAALLLNLNGGARLARIEAGRIPGALGERTIESAAASKRRPQ